MGTFEEFKRQVEWMEVQVRTAQLSATEIRSTLTEMTNRVEQQRRHADHLARDVAYWMSTRPLLHVNNCASCQLLFITAMDGSTLVVTHAHEPAYVEIEFGQCGEYAGRILTGYHYRTPPQQMATRLAEMQNGQLVEIVRRMPNGQGGVQLQVEVYADKSALYTVTEQRIYQLSGPFSPHGVEAVRACLDTPNEPPR